MDDDGERGRGVVRPTDLLVLVSILQFCLLENGVVVLLALDRLSRRLGFFGGHFISISRREIPNLMLRRGGGGPNARTNEGSEEKSGLGFQEIVKNPGHLLAE